VAISGDQPTPSAKIGCKKLNESHFRQVRQHLTNEAPASIGTPRPAC